MDNNVVSALSEIRTAIYILLAIVTLGVIANWIRAWASVKNMLEKELAELFTKEAGDFHDKGKFDELLIYCEEKLESKPNHSYALWYKAKAHYQKHEYDKSKECFGKLEIIEPSWGTSHILPYLEKIKAIENELHKSD